MFRIYGKQTSTFSSGPLLYLACLLTVGACFAVHTWKPIPVLLLALPLWGIIRLFTRTPPRYEEDGYCVTYRMQGRDYGTCTVTAPNGTAPALAFDSDASLHAMWVYADRLLQDVNGKELSDEEADVLVQRMMTGLAALGRQPELKSLHR